MTGAGTLMLTDSLFATDETAGPAPKRPRHRCTPILLPCPYSKVYYHHVYPCPTKCTAQKHVPNTGATATHPTPFVPNHHDHSSPTTYTRLHARSPRVDTRSARFGADDTQIPAMLGSVFHRFVPCHTIPNCANLYHETQQGGNCFLHALNHGLQQSFFKCSTIAPYVNRPPGSPNAASGWYDANEISTAVQELSGGHLVLRAGHPHTGLLSGSGWSSTLAAQRFRTNTAPFVILLVNEMGLMPFRRRHVICAIRRSHTERQSRWLILDSCHPGVAGPLSDDSVAHAFNADIYYIDFADTNVGDMNALPTRQQLLRYLSPPTPQARDPTQPTHPVTPWPGYSADPADATWQVARYSPTCLHLFVPTNLLRNRTALLHICNREGLSLIAHARHTMDNTHLRLTITRQDHLHALHTTPPSTISHLVQQRTGWRLTGMPQPAMHPAGTVPQPPIQTHNRFSPLTSYAGTCLNDDTTATASPHRAQQEHPTAQSPIADPPQVQHATQTGTLPASFRFMRNARIHHPRRRTVTVGTFNVNGLNANNILAVIGTMTARNIDILAIQESHEKRSARIPPQQDHTYYGELSLGTRKGGGTGFMVHNACKQIFTYLGPRKVSGNAADLKKFKATWARIEGKGNHSNVWLASVYLPHAGSGDIIAAARAELEHDINFYKRKPGRVLLLGDFNARVKGHDMPDATEHTQHGPQSGDVIESPAGRELLSMCERSDMFFLSGRTHQPQIPTFRNSVASSIIDHIIGCNGTLPWSHSVATIPHSEADITPCLSDHTLLTVTAQICKGNKQRKPTPYARWRLGELQNTDTLLKYRTQLRQRAHSLYAITNSAQCGGKPTQATVDAAVTALVNIIDESAMAAFGKKHIAPGKTKAWMTTKLRRTLDHRRHAHTRWLQQKTPANAAALHLADLAAKQALRIAKREHKKLMATRLNKTWAAAPGGHSAWNILKSTKAQDDLRTVTALQSSTGELKTDTKGKLEILRQHYSSLAAPSMTSPQSDATGDHVTEHHAKIEQAVQEMVDNPQPDHPTLDAPITRAEIEKAVDKLKRYKSPGDDGIPAELVKEGSNCMLDMLTAVFNVIWRAELVPSCWRKGIIVSLFKAGDRTDCSNYRPITLLPVVDKLFAAVLTARLEPAIPLHDHQSAFRKNRGTLDPLFVLASIVQERKSKNLRTHAFFLDLKKAFDVVWHSGLFYKLYHKGVQGKTWRVIRDMYAKGESAPRLDQQTTDYFPIQQGVFQGDPLSPLLFVVMIDDLLEVLHEHCHTEGITIVPSIGNLVSQAFADDDASVSGSRIGLQRIINKIKDHLDLWKQPANPSKCHIVTFNPNGLPTDSNGTPCQEAGPDQWYWGEDVIETRDKTKNLGLIMTSDCTWAAQTTHARTKGLAAYHTWKETLCNPYIHRETKLTIIKTCIKPSITYGMEIWAAPPTMTASLETPLKLALRAAVGIPHGSERKRYPVNLIHNDTAVRSIASDAKAAHVRFLHRVQHLPASRLQRHVLDMLQPNNSWRVRVDSYCAELINADPVSELADTLRALGANNTHTPPPVPDLEPRPTPNQAINKSVARADSLRYITKACQSDRPILARALRARPCHTSQSYLAYGSARSQLLIRSGHFLRDSEHEALPAHDEHTDPALREQLHTRCPDCHEIVNEEHVGDDNARQYRVLLHRVTACAPMLAVAQWYHDAAVRICPTMEMALALAGARRAATSHSWETDCLPFLDHLLSPLEMCRRHDTTQQRSMMKATRLFLTTVQDNLNALPDPATLGDIPVIVLDPITGESLRPFDDNVIDDNFWAALVRRLPPSVPPAQPQAVSGPEAEALWAGSSGRRSRRLLGLGVMPD